MVSKKVFLLLLFCFSFTICCAFSFEIPIGNTPIERNVEKSKDDASGGILFVDMEKVFNSHPMTQMYKKEIKEFANTRKNVIEGMVQELHSLENQAQNINLKFVQAQSENNEQFINELSKQFEDIKSLIGEQKLKIIDLSSRTKNEIALMEEKNTASVLKNIELLLKEVSKKQNVDVVLDKQSVLTGKGKDVTDEIIKMAKDR
ncbi:MAG: OmpH family outer membrane protein [Endomicrobium sp.]|jgi:Skp family chaperone for outer membrane proteins|nr:OmpH family outer membrane protein [Endomicrobium sp.]